MLQSCVRPNTFPAAALLLGPLPEDRVFQVERFAFPRLPWPAVVSAAATTGRLHEAAQLIAAADLAWCAELAGNVLVHEPALADALRSAPLVGADGWIPLDMESSPERIAAQWITATAGQLWQWFARERTSSRARIYTSLVTARDVDAVGFGSELFVEALCQRLRVGIERTGRVIGGEGWPDAAVFGSASDLADQLLGDLDDLVLEDLLQVNLPYPRQFQKYRAGGGAGQSE